MDCTIRVTVRMTIKTSNAKSWMGGSAIISKIKLLLREWCYQQSKTIQLLRRQNAIEDLKIVLAGN